MLTHDNCEGATQVRARLVTHPNGGTRVLVTCNGRSKRMPFDNGARDQHTDAIAKATGIAESRLVETSRTLDGRAYHVEPYVSEEYSGGVDAYELETCRATPREAARRVFAMREDQDADQLMREYDKLTSEGASFDEHRDAFLSILADISE